MTVEPLVVLRVKHAVRRYGEETVLDDVSLDIKAGEVYALIGRNGAGKSTLAKAAIGALALNSGSVRVMGYDPARQSAARRVVGIAPQEIALYQHLTIAENVDAFAALSGVRSNRTKAVAEAMTQTACAGRAHDRLDRLSGGWRRRANLAAAIVHKPRLLVLDEPTEGLDAETRAIVRELIDVLRAQETAILLVSHDAEDVASLADRVGVLRAGRLVADGAPTDLMRRAFGGRRELILRLGVKSHAGSALMIARGLASSDDGLSWSGLIEEATACAVQIDQELRAVGIPVRELTVRPAGLNALIGWAGDGSS